MTTRAGKKRLASAVFGAPAGAAFRKPGPAQTTTLAAPACAARPNAARTTAQINRGFTRMQNSFWTTLGQTLAADDHRPEDLDDSLCSSSAGSDRRYAAIGCERPPGRGTIRRTSFTLGDTGAVFKPQFRSLPAHLPTHPDASLTP